MRTPFLVSLFLSLFVLADSFGESPQVTRSVSLYFGSKDGRGLIAENREVTFIENKEELLSFLVWELISGPEKGGVRLIPPNTVLRHTFSDEDGVAFVDFSGSISAPSQGGILFEWLLTTSIIRTVLENTGFVKGIVFLIDGRPASTLLGHIDLTEQLTLEDVFPGERKAEVR